MTDLFKNSDKNINITIICPPIIMQPTQYVNNIDLPDTPDDNDDLGDIDTLPENSDVDADTVSLDDLVDDLNQQVSLLMGMAEKFLHLTVHYADAWESIHTNDYMVKLKNHIGECEKTKNYSDLLDLSREIKFKNQFLNVLTTYMNPEYWAHLDPKYLSFHHLMLGGMINVLLTPLQYKPETIQATIKLMLESFIRTESVDLNNILKTLNEADMLIEKAFDTCMIGLF